MLKRNVNQKANKSFAQDTRIVQRYRTKQKMLKYVGIPLLTYMWDPKISSN